MSSPHDHTTRMARARRSLQGLSVGDAFGEQFFRDRLVIEPLLASRQMTLDGPWRWTDDTAMALDIVEELDERLEIIPDALSARFTARYVREPWRGYGGGAHGLFERICNGESWDVAASTMFGDQGSFGNGGAMRAAPLGAYFADAALEEVAAQAKRSARPTHAHEEGEAGAVAIAVASASVWQTRALGLDEARSRLWHDVLAHTPESQVLERIKRASNVALDAQVAFASSRLGNGSKISAQDTVPICIWQIARNLRDYERAMWDTVMALGDRDTTCAIVGGVIATASPEVEIPPEWLECREPLEGIPLSNEVPRYYD